MGTSLPTNVDASYADDPNDPSRVTHQKHHDAIHDFTNTHDGKLGAAAHAGLAIVSATAPASPVDNQLWYDTAAELMKRWDAAANAGAGAWKAEGNAAYRAKTSPAVRVYRSTAQTLATATATAITFDTENFDRLGMWVVGAPTRLTVPSGYAGDWLVLGSVGFATNTTGMRFVHIYKNGANVAVSGVGAASGQVRVPVSTVVNAAVGDYFELVPYQTSGGNLDPEAGSEFTWLAAHYLGSV